MAFFIFYSKASLEIRDTFLATRTKVPPKRNKVSPVEVQKYRFFEITLFSKYNRTLEIIAPTTKQELQKFHSSRNVN